MATSVKRKRITPELVNTSPLSPEELNVQITALGPNLPVTDLKEQSNLAPKLLGPGRKIWIDLHSYQSSGDSVDWRKILKAKGIKLQDISKTRPTLELPVDGAPMDVLAPAQGLQRTKAGSNRLDKVIARLERTYCAQVESDDEESGGDEGQAAQDEAECSGSDSDNEGDNEDEEEEGEGRDGQFAGGKGSGSGSGTDKAKADGVKKKQHKKGKKGVGEYSYDNEDGEFLDDSELLEYIGRAQKKTKHLGFFITKGELEVEDGGAGDDTEQEERGKKRAEKRVKPPPQQVEGGADDDFQQPPKPKEKGGDEGHAEQKKAKKKKKRKLEGESRPVGDDAGGAHPPKKKKKRPTNADVAAATAEPAGAAGALSIAQLAAASGAIATQQGRQQQPLPAAVNLGTAGSRPSGDASASPSAVKKARELYVLPPDVEAALQRVREVAARCAPSQQDSGAPEGPAGAGGGGGASAQQGGTAEEGAAKTLRIPPEVLTEIKALLPPLYERERKRIKGAGATIVDMLMDFLSPYTTRPNLLLKLKAGQEGRTPQQLWESLQKAMETEKLAWAQCAVAPPPSDDDFQQAPPSQEAPSSQQGAAAAGKLPVPAKKLSLGARKSLIAYIDARLQQGTTLDSDAGAELLRQVAATLPAAAELDAAWVKQIYQDHETKRKKAAQQAQQQPQAVAGAAGDAKKGKGGGGGRGPAAGRGAAIMDAEMFANLAVQAAQAGQAASKVGPAKRAPAAQAAPTQAPAAAAATTAAPAAAATVEPAVPPAATQRLAEGVSSEGREAATTSAPSLMPADMAAPAGTAREAHPSEAGAAQQEGQRGNIPAPPAAKAVASLAAAPAAAVPAGIPVVNGAGTHAPDQQQGAEGAQKEGGEGGSATPQLLGGSLGDAAAAAAVPAELAGTEQAAAAVPAPVPAMSDDELVKEGVRLGAEEGQLRGALDRVVSSTRKWEAPLVKALMVVGGEGLLLKGIQEKAAAMRLVSQEDAQKKWDKARERLIQDRLVAHVGGYRYALPCFPGVVHLPMKSEKEAKEGGAAAPVNSEAA